MAVRLVGYWFQGLQYNEYLGSDYTDMFLTMRGANDIEQILMHPGIMTVGRCAALTTIQDAAFVGIGAHMAHIQRQP